MTVAEVGARARPEAAMHSPRGPFSLLADTRFRRLWIGQAVSELGDGMAGLALVVLVHRLAGTMSAIAMLSILTSLPQIMVGLHAGVLVDRWDRRRTMIACDVVRALLAAALVFAQDPRSLPWIYALAIAQAAASVFFEPARTAFLPAVVEPRALLQANSFSQSTRMVSMTAGAALAGLLLAFPAGARWVFALDALSFAISALVLRAIGPVEAAAAPVESSSLERSTSLTAELIEGLRMLFGNPALLALLVTFAITLLGTGAVGVLFVPFMLRDLGASTFAVGIVRSAQTVGMLLGAALLAGPGARWSPARVLGFGIAGLGPCLALMGWAPHWIALLPLLVGIGMCSSATQAGSVTILQQGVPDRARGRAESALDTLLMAVMLIAMAGAGFFGDRFGARAVFLTAGVLAVLAALVGRTWRSAERFANVHGPQKDHFIGEPGSR